MEWSARSGEIDEKGPKQFVTDPPARKGTSRRTGGAGAADRGRPEVCRQKDPQKKPLELRQTRTPPARLR